MNARSGDRLSSSVNGPFVPYTTTGFSADWWISAVYVRIVPRLPSSSRTRVELVRQADSDRVHADLGVCVERVEEHSTKPFRDIILEVIEQKKNETRQESHGKDV